MKRCSLVFVFLWLVAPFLARSVNQWRHNINPTQALLKMYLSQQLPAADYAALDLKRLMTHYKDSAAPIFKIPFTEGNRLLVARKNGSGFDYVVLEYSCADTNVDRPGRRTIVIARPGYKQKQLRHVMTGTFSVKADGTIDQSAGTRKSRKPTNPHFCQFPLLRRSPTDNKHEQEWINISLLLDSEAILKNAVKTKATIIQEYIPLAFVDQKMIHIAYSNVAKR
jgi:hypothetical protein